MRWPALLAALLLVVAPVASRLLEAATLPVPLCTAAGFQADADLPPPHGAVRAGHEDASGVQRDHGPANAFAGLRPERTTQLDLGLQYRGASVQGWVSAYAGRVQDFILFTYADGGMMGTTTRVDNVDARIAGAEAGVEWQPLHGLTLGGTLAYAWGENRSDGTPLPQMPPLESRLRLDWEGQRWSAGALLRAVARQGRVALDQGNVVGRDLGRSAGFATLGLSGGYRVSEGLRLSAGIDNVFDRRYSEHLNLAGSADFGFPADPVLRIAEPGRNLWLKGNYRF